jgi:hypothetical protein
MGSCTVSACRTARAAPAPSCRSGSSSPRRRPADTAHTARDDSRRDTCAGRTRAAFGTARRRRADAPDLALPARRRWGGVWPWTWLGSRVGSNWPQIAAQVSVLSLSRSIRHSPPSSQAFVTHTRRHSCLPQCLSARHRVWHRTSSSAPWLSRCRTQHGSVCLVSPQRHGDVVGTAHGAQGP